MNTKTIELFSHLMGDFTEKGKYKANLILEDEITGKETSKIIHIPKAIYILYELVDIIPTIKKEKNRLSTEIFEKYEKQYYYLEDYFHLIAEYYYPKKELTFNGFLSEFKPNQDNVIEAQFWCKKKIITKK